MNYIYFFVGIIAYNSEIILSGAELSPMHYLPLSEKLKEDHLCIISFPSIEKNNLLTSQF